MREPDQGERGGAAAADVIPVERLRRRPPRGRPRAITIRTRSRVLPADLALGRIQFPPVDDPRPRTRAECHDAHRPCPWVACKFHLYLDVNPESGAVKLNFPDLEPGEMVDTCALDVAERGGLELERVGELMNITRERVRQIEVRALLKIKMASPSESEPGAALTRRPGAHAGKGDR